MGRKRKQYSTEEALEAHRKQLERQRAWREKNREQIAQYNRQYKSLNRGDKTHRIYLKTADKHGVTTSALLGLMAAQGGVCVFCGVSLETDRHLDHVIPKSRGGENRIENYQWLCAKCNMMKHNLGNDEFISHIGKILKNLDDREYVEGMMEGAED